MWNKLFKTIFICLKPYYLPRIFQKRRGNVKRIHILSFLFFLIVFTFKYIRIKYLLNRQFLIKIYIIKLHSVSMEHNSLEKQPVIAFLIWNYLLLFTFWSRVMPVSNGHLNFQWGDYPTNYNCCIVRKECIKYFIAIMAVARCIVNRENYQFQSIANQSVMSWPDSNIYYIDN